jgi:hypothetical protein
MSLNDMRIDDGHEHNDETRVEDGYEHDDETVVEDGYEDEDETMWIGMSMMIRRD